MTQSFNNMLKFRYNDFNKGISTKKFSDGGNILNRMIQYARSGTNILNIKYDPENAASIYSNNNPGGTSYFKSKHIGEAGTNSSSKQNGVLTDDVALAADEEDDESTTGYSHYSTAKIEEDELFPIYGQSSVRTFSGSKQEFVSAMRSAYKNAGITNPDLINLLVAQDILESDWGTLLKANYNYGNIHRGSSWNGPVRDGTDSGTPTQFREYASPEEYIADKWKLLSGRIYGITNDDDPNTAIAKLTGENASGYKYATATNYANSLQDLYTQVSAM